MNGEIVKEVEGFKWLKRLKEIPRCAYNYVLVIH
jgi:hypothetical protein